MKIGNDKKVGQIVYGKAERRRAGFLVEQPGATGVLNINSIC